MLEWRKSITNTLVGLLITSVKLSHDVVDVDSMIIIVIGSMEDSLRVKLHLL